MKTVIFLMQHNSIPEGRKMQYPDNTADWLIDNRICREAAEKEEQIETVEITEHRISDIVTKEEPKKRGIKNKNA